MSVDAPISATCCALCGENRKLELSHIVPQFVYRWRREAAVDEAAKHAPAVTRRMLCGRCEDLFSSYESEFARKVFHPFATNSVVSAKYGGWLRKFAVSVCWRVLEEHIGEKRLDHSEAQEMCELNHCRQTWRDYLRGKCPDVGTHHVHFLPWRPNAERTGNVQQFAVEGLSNAARATIETDVSRHGPDVFVYARLGPILFFGLIADPEPGRWQGTRINAEGKLKPRDISLPETYWEYLRTRETPAH